MHHLLLSRILAATASAVLLAGVATACGGSGDSPAKADSPSGAAAPTGSERLTGPGAPALKGLANDLSKTTYQVTYDVEAAADGKTTKSSMTLSQKPPKTASIAITSDGQVIAINDGTSSLLCIGPSGKGECSKFKSGPDATTTIDANAFAVIAKITSAGTVEVTDKGGRTIAGADSRCFTIKTADGDQSSSCYRKSDGITTYVESKTKDGQLVKMTATKIATTVDDRVFAPPAGYTVVEDAAAAAAAGSPAAGAGAATPEATPPLVVVAPPTATAGSTPSAPPSTAARHLFTRSADGRLVLDLAASYEMPDAQLLVIKLKVVGLVDGTTLTSERVRDALAAKGIPGIVSMTPVAADTLRVQVTTGLLATPQQSTPLLDAIAQVAFPAVAPPAASPPPPVATTAAPAPPTTVAPPITVARHLWSRGSDGKLVLDLAASYETPDPETLTIRVKSVPLADGTSLTSSRVRDALAAKGIPGIVAMTAVAADVLRVQVTKGVILNPPQLNALYDAIAGVSFQAR